MRGNMKKSIFSICLLILCLSAPAKMANGAEDAKTINVKEARELLQNKSDIIIADVRTPAEFAKGHLPHAQNIDFFGKHFEMSASRLPKDKKILVYCRSGNRSSAAAEALKEMGLKHIVDMNEGFQAWEKAGLPVEK